MFNARDTEYNVSTLSNNYTLEQYSGFLYCLLIGSLYLMRTAVLTGNDGLHLVSDYLQKHDDEYGSGK